NIVRAKKHSDMTVKAIRNINLADAAVSVLALQTSMMRSFGQGEPAGFSATMNAITGSAVFAFVFALGIFMVLKSKKLLAAADGDVYCDTAESECLSNGKES
ncbi:MAG: hypothetical protein K2N32_04830, partial [Clostridia bacterium]|nr:hypothetical protein [Clostridia bacterium]